jgi:hypothetical protein
MLVSISFCRGGGRGIYMLWICERMRDGYKVGDICSGDGIRVFLGGYLRLQGMELEFTGSQPRPSLPLH